MRKLLSLIFICILLSCNSQPKQNMNVILHIEEISGFNVLKVEIINNTGKNIYINKIGGTYLYENLNIINKKYVKGDSSFIYDEASYNKNKFSSSIDIIDSLNRSKDFFTELEDLEKLPFTISKDLVKNAINVEYKQLIREHNPCLLTTNDISLIKFLILYKYQGTIFLKPNETYRQYLPINSLFYSNYPSKLIFDYHYDDKVEEININLDYPGDTISINTIPLERIGDYILFKEGFKSDTIYIN